MTPSHLGRPPRGYLVSRAMEKLRRFFQGKDHSPSPSMWQGLEALLQVIEDQAHGEAEAKVSLSALCPGVGKSSAIRAAIEVILENPVWYGDVGVLLLVSRLSEVETTMQEVGIPRSLVCVLTSDEATNALGSATANSAPILITTQQRLERMLTGRSFADLSSLHFGGRPRVVRCWDESYLPGRGITINLADLGSLFGLLNRLSPALLETVVGLFNEARSAADGSVINVPDFVAMHGVDVGEVIGAIESERRDEVSRLVADLWYLSGRSVLIRRDGGYGNVFLSYRTTLPEDLAPLLVTDASGRCRDAYRDLEARGLLNRLPSITKRYDPLTVHVWRRGGGKTSWQNDPEDLLEGIALTIDSKPEEEWLVVHHKPNAYGIGDIPEQIRKRLKVTKPERVSFLTWGQHQATNAYVTTQNLVLAGTLFFRASHYEALKRLTSDRPAAAGEVTKGELEKVTLGEHAHLVLQALARGKVRKCNGEYCHPMHAYVIASQGSGIAELIPELFPGCTVQTWEPIVRPLQGRVADAGAYLTQWVESSAMSDVLPFRVVAKALGMSAHDFGKNVRRHRAFQDVVVNRLGLEEFGKGKYMTGFRRIAAVFTAGDAA